jgi:hypothetical protein
VLVCARYLAERGSTLGATAKSDGGEHSVHLIAIGNVGIAALHAAALEPKLFDRVKLTQSLVSWSNILHHTLNRYQAACVVHAALTCYDLPDLETLLGTRLTVEQPTDAEGTVIDVPPKTS